MSRYFFLLIILIHGIIHLAGFLKESGYGFANALNGKRLITMGATTSKVVGTLWLVCCSTFVVAAVFYLIRKDWYWVPLLAAIVLSQILIIVYWHDAKFGSIVNVVLLVSVIVSVSKFQFDRKFNQVAQSVISKRSADSIEATEDKLRSLPANVKRWLQRSNVSGKRNSNVIHVFQRGYMRLKPDASWMPFSGEEYFTIDPPSFVWKAEISASSFMEIGGRDKYEDGKGNMVIKPMYVYTLANAKGEQINQATLLRYLAEITWFPQAAVSNYLHWEELDSLHARVTMTYKGVSASGIFTFNDDGLVSGFEAQRYGDFDGGYRLETWSVNVTGYKVFGGKTIGNANEVIWKLKDGDFLWLKMEVTDID